MLEQVAYVAVVVVALSGCYRPSVRSCQYACAADRSCPEGLTCSATGAMCVAAAADTCSPLPDGGSGGGSGSDGGMTACTLFASPVYYTALTEPLTVAIGSADGPANDVVTASHVDSDFSVLLGNGNGTLGERIDTPVGSGTVAINVTILPTAVGATVVLTELTPATGSSSFSVEVATGTAFAQLTALLPPPGGQPTSSAAVGQIDEDPDADLVVGDSALAGVETFLDAGGGGLAVASALTGFSAHPIVVAIGDVSGDAIADIVTGNDDASYQVARHNAGSGFTILTHVPLVAVPVAIELIDLNGDKQLDLAAVSDATLTTAISNGDGTFAPALELAIPSGTHTAVAADFDRDGLVDLAVASEATDTVTVFINGGAGSFEPGIPIPLKSGCGAWGVAAGDLDGDDWPDLVVTCATTGEVAVLLDTCS